MRLIDWEERLRVAIARHAALPFAWSVSDCFTLPMDCVDALTGRDPWGDVRRYKDFKGSLRQLRKHGCKTIGDAFAKKFSEIAPAAAMRGDIGVAQYDVDQVGVVILGHEIIGKATSGLMRWPRHKLIRAFQVN